MKKYLIILVVIVISGGIFYFRSKAKQQALSNPIVNQAQADLDSNSATPRVKDINQDFTFTIGTGNNSAEIKYTINTVELTDEIFVKGQPAKSASGRQFLVVNLKLTNEGQRGILIDTRNYLRLSTAANEEEWIAPDLHNDPVEVQAISTKYTRLGFPVSIADNSFRLQVGDIAGDKQLIEISF